MSPEEEEVVKNLLFAVLALLVVVPFVLYHRARPRPLDEGEARLIQLDSPLNCFYIGFGWSLAQHYGQSLDKAAAGRFGKIVSSRSFRMGQAMPAREEE